MRDDAMARRTEISAELNKMGMHVVRKHFADLACLNHMLAPVENMRDLVGS